MKNIVTADALIGMTVLSKVSGNKLGEVADLFIDPMKGVLMGLTIKNSKGDLGGLDYNDVSSFGEDAVMANADDKIVPLEDNWVKTHSHAKKHLMGINVVTESGNLIGKVADIYVRLSAPPIVIYEIGETVLDRWLGRDFFIPASAGTALSNNAERIVISNEAANAAAPTLKALFTEQNSPLYVDNTSRDVIAEDRFDPRLEHRANDRVDEQETILRRRNTA